VGLHVKANDRIIDLGHYTAPSGREVDIDTQVTTALTSTRLYVPSELELMLGTGAFQHHEGGAPKIEVIESKTGDAGRWLTREAGVAPAILNFASARNPGGGYLRGAKAQEEDLCRCSALYNTLTRQPQYYKANKGQKSLLYTHNMVYSPLVPFFRDDEYQLQEVPAFLNVITAPAPNAGEVLRRDPTAGPEIEKTLRRRAGMILAIAEQQEVRNLVLGAWGCGVFRNDPAMVADAFGKWLESKRFNGCFDRVVFGIYASGLPGQVALECFRQRFA
jgi:uncharacterized protein (TIGR02452 family)